MRRYLNNRNPYYELKLTITNEETNKKYIESYVVTRPTGGRRYAIRWINKIIQGKYNQHLHEPYTSSALDNVAHHNFSKHNNSLRALSNSNREFIIEFNIGFSSITISFIYVRLKSVPEDKDVFTHIYDSYPAPTLKFDMDGCLYKYADPENSLPDDDDWIDDWLWDDDDEEYDFDDEL